MAKPIHEEKRGPIKARIWRKQTRSGLRHTVAVVRLYRDGDVWRESTRFGRDDLPLIRLVLDLAHTWILQNGRAPDSLREKRGENHRPYGMR